MLKKLTYLSIFIVYFCFFTLVLSSQSITWQRLYDGPTHSQETGHDICSDGNGNFFIIGTTFIPNFSGQIFVLKINPYGDTIWTKILGYNNRNETGRAIVSSGDGGCVLTGGGMDTSFTIKLDAKGDIVWWKTYDWGSSSCDDIIKTSDGGYIACGDKANGFSAGYILKVSSTGNYEWSNIYPEATFRSFTTITESLNGGFIAVGTSSALTSQDTTKALITKVDNSGNLLWEKKFKVTEGTGAYSIARHTHGYLISGSTVLFSSGNSSYPYFVKIDTSGTIIYSKTYPADTPAYQTPLNIINANRIVLGYSVDSVGAQNWWNGKLMVVDSLGNIIYQKTFPSGGSLDIRSVLTLTNGDILAVGELEPDSVGGRDIYAVRTDSMLNAPPIAIEIISTIIPSTTVLLPSYPNPFNPITTIQFDISNPGNIIIQIFDVNGKEVEILYNDFLKSGKYSIKWNASNFASGIYFCKLNINNKYHFSQKLILIK